MFYVNVHTYLMLHLHITKMSKSHTCSMGILNWFVGYWTNQSHDEVMRLFVKDNLNEENVVPVVLASSSRGSLLEITNLTKKRTLNSAEEGSKKKIKLQSC
ncbi:uncharacterized protein LOC123688586 [Harmonia axyridis]|uniref:uncharacterized protein LOC123688586 n=1 Tax=Harmonia axyridis TaxID=115357 RepID=UPI001E2757C8|nr:uncharacterized protein LOC123688586 [Harmonia axyridis]